VILFGDAEESAEVAQELGLRHESHTTKINYGHYVEEAVSSVDDGSADNTASRLRRFGNATRYLYKPNGGQASAFNYGFQHARGEVVAVLDADDVWLPEKLARISRGIRTPPQCRDGLPPHVLVGRRK